VDRDESGRAVRSSASARNPKKKLAEEQVRASQRAVPHAGENAATTHLHSGHERYITSWNLGRSARRLSREEYLGKHFRAFSWPHHAARGDPGMQLQFASIQDDTKRGLARAKNGAVLGARHPSRLCSTRPENRAASPRSLTNVTNASAEEDLHSYADRLKTTSSAAGQVQSGTQVLARELHTGSDRISPRSG